VASIIAVHRHRFAIMSDERAKDRCSVTVIECNAIANSELEHGVICLHLLKELEPFHNPVIEVAQFRFAQFVDVDDQFVSLFHHSRNYPNSSVLLKMVRSNVT
jgi:hypothetical protein